MSRADMFSYISEIDQRTKTAETQPPADEVARIRAQEALEAAQAADVEAPAVDVDAIANVMRAGHPGSKPGVIDQGHKTVDYEASDADVVLPPPKLTWRERFSNWWRAVQNRRHAIGERIRLYRERKAALREQRIADAEAERTAPAMAATKTAVEAEPVVQQGVDEPAVITEERRETIMETRRLWAERGKRALWILLILLALAFLYLMARKYGATDYLADKTHTFWAWLTTKQVSSESGAGKQNLVGDSSTKRIITETTPATQPIVINTAVASTQPVPAVVVNVNSGVTKTVEVHETPEETQQRIANEKQKNKWDDTYRKFLEDAKENKLNPGLDEIFKVESPTDPDGSGRRFLAFYDGTETDFKQFVRFETAPFDEKHEKARVFAKGTAPSLPAQNLAGFRRIEKATFDESGTKKTIHQDTVVMAATSEVAAQYLVFSENVNVSSKTQGTPTLSNGIEFVSLDGVMFCGHVGRKRYDWFYDGLELGADHKPTGRRNPVKDPMRAGRGYLIVSPCPFDEVLAKHPNIFAEAAQKFNEKYGKIKD